MGMKAGDDKVVPLCHMHHMELHHGGNELTFFEKYGYDYEHVKGYAETLYRETKDGVENWLW